MRKYLTLILVKKTVTLAWALAAVGFVHYYGAMNEELLQAKRELRQKDDVIATLELKPAAVPAPAPAPAPAPSQVTDIARVMKAAVPVKVTCYSNAQGQTDEEPDVCAWGNKFTEYFKGFKTIAISRDLLQKGWKFGDLIYVAGVGKCIVWDLMHPRMKKSIDLALYDTDKFDNFKSVAVPLGQGTTTS
ncbi:MAG: hypothetical protein HY900_29680 [Deltaproteobacteria bacterium]|nr:hypothetical protein [Deltaproteobacteria bacterium]